MGILTQITINSPLHMSQSILSQLAQEFFSLLWVNFSDLEISTQDEEKHIYTIKISSEDSSLLIGPHGRTLEEIQTLFAQMLEKHISARPIIHIEINDYLAEKQRKLFLVIDRKIELTRKNGIEQVVYNLSSYERKQVHGYISEKYTDIVTHSVDGEKGRELHIGLKEGVIPTGVPEPVISQNAEKDLEALDLDGINI